ncbi:hypothetical protein SNE40_004306 [Patella caerulea]|uniref:Uncharacterized protein n=1 Tax=Patella caerulea TaxID=87958 RepID=A0AAN8K2M9_PATCE
MEEGNNEDREGSKDGDSLEIKEKSRDQEIKETVGDLEEKGEKESIIEKEAALVEQMAFSDSWPEQVERESKEKERENAKRKAGQSNETSGREHGTRIKERKMKLK